MFEPKEPSKPALTQKQMREGAGGTNQEELSRLDKVEKMEGITEKDLSREMPEKGGAEVVMLRHGKYIRDTKHEQSGSLVEGEAANIYEQTLALLRSKFDGLLEEDRKDVTFLVVASDTSYGNAKGMRSFETAAEVSRAIRDIIQEYGLSPSQFLNIRSKRSREAESAQPAINKTIREPQMFENSPEFVAFLKEQYGDRFFAAFESESEYLKGVREKMGAEGVEDILERYSKFMDILRNFSDVRHEKNPNERLLIFPVSHYDTISPYVKEKIMRLDTKEYYLPVEYGAGVSINIDPKGVASSVVGGRKYILDKTNRQIRKEGK